APRRELGRDGNCAGAGAYEGSARKMAGAAPADRHAGEARPARRRARASLAETGLGGSRGPHARTSTHRALIPPSERARRWVIFFRSREGIMLRYLAGVGSALLLVAAGFFIWQSVAQDE